MMTDFEQQPQQAVTYEQLAVIATTLEVKLKYVTTQLQACEFTLEEERKLHREALASNERMYTALRNIAGHWSDEDVKPMSDAKTIDYLIDIATKALSK